KETGTPITRSDGRQSARVATTNELSPVPVKAGCDTRHRIGATSSTDVAHHTGGQSRIAHLEHLTAASRLAEHVTDARCCDRVCRPAVVERTASNRSTELIDHAHFLHASGYVVFRTLARGIVHPIARLLFAPRDNEVVAHQCPLRAGHFEPLA